MKSALLCVSVVTQQQLIHFRSLSNTRNSVGEIFILGKIMQETQVWLGQVRWQEKEGWSSDGKVLRGNRR